MSTPSLLMSTSFVSEPEVTLLETIVCVDKGHFSISRRKWQLVYGNSSVAMNE